MITCHQTKIKNLNTTKQITPPKIKKHKTKIDLQQNETTTKINHAKEMQLTLQCHIYKIFIIKETKLKTKKSLKSKLAF